MLVLDYQVSLQIITRRGGACPHPGRPQGSPLREGDRKGRPYAPTAEVHILDFNRNIYGEELTFHFLRKIRDEITFSNPDELKRQIEKDIAEVRSI